ncbi:hypothetical protein STANM309S_03017 [Streptomyces tanashiensis]
MYGFIGALSVKSLFWSVSTRTVPAAGSYSMPKTSVVSPSRVDIALRVAARLVAASEKRLNWYEPAGAVQLWVAAVKTGPATGVTWARQVASPSVSGSVAVTQSTILRSPVVVFCRAGWPRSTPESRMPMVTPRPSAFGCSLTKSTAPVSCEGLYGFFAGVFLPGAGYVVVTVVPATAPVAAPASGVGSSSAISAWRSTDWTEESWVAALMAAAALAVGRVART